MAISLKPYYALTRRLAGALAVVALAFHALLPSGYMLNANTKGDGIEITLCTQDGNVTAFMAPDGSISQTNDAGSGTDHDGSDPNAPCDFALHSGALVFDTPRFLADLPAHPIICQESGLTFVLAPGQGLAAPPPPKTGPPIQA
jgi:hypothetical protein